MSEPLQYLEKIFPNLAASGYSPKSEKSTAYNCIAYAAGDETRKWEGYHEKGYYWPDGAKEGHSLDALVNAFEQLGYCICDHETLEASYEKVVLYVDKDGLWSHAAKQCPDGQWTSKLGNLEDIVHRMSQALAGPEPAYGQVACYMKRRRLEQTDDRQNETSENVQTG
jgi:hypothetical protein